MKPRLLLATCVVLAVLAFASPAGAETIHVDTKAKTTKLEVLYEAAVRAAKKACRGESPRTKVDVGVYRGAMRYGYDWRCSEVRGLSTTMS